MGIFRRYTVRSLCQNKTRTFVTIIGIVLSVALITAVTTSVSSLLNYMLEVVVEDQGCWHVSVGNADKEEIQSVLARTEIEKSAVLSDIAYGKLETVKQESTPYLHINGFSGDFTELLSLRMKEGRLPENPSELIIPDWLAGRAGVSYQVGESIEIETGVRRRKGEGEVIWQAYPYDEQQETFEGNGKKTYQIVGIYESADFGYGEMDQELAGFPVLTRSDADIPMDRGMIYLTMKNLDGIADFMDELAAEGDYIVSQNFTYVKAVRWDWGDDIVSMLMGMAAILIVIIMFGSISLIYNSFAISVNERKKQYGLLSSVGATGKQLRASVIFEAVVLSVIGVPVGVLVGVGGMAATFYLLRDTFNAFLGVGATGVVIHMSAAAWAVAVSAAIGFVTVLISAYLPAGRALKLNVIDAIRQTKDIAVKPEKLKTFQLTGKVFGLEGILGSKNYKRNKKRYRATVFSLFISIVLFISASSFSGYLSDSLGAIIEHYDCDIEYGTDPIQGRSKIEQSLPKMEELFQKMERVNGITDPNIHYSFWEARLELPKKCLSDNAVKQADPVAMLGIEENGQEEKIGKGNGVYSNIIVSFIEDSVYEEYLKENGLDPATYLDKQNPTALIFQKDVAFWSSKKNRYVYNRVFEENPGTSKLSFEIWPENEEGTEEWIDPYISGKKTITIGEIREETMKGFGSEQYVDPVILFPLSALDAIVPDDATMSPVMNFKAEDSNQACADMQDILDQGGYGGSLYNVADKLRINHALMTVLNVFSYGFILLISLIAVANVFNTISTNIYLRRREFAMLRSVGMTRKSFYRMLNYECILYGVKGIIYGLPSAIGVTALIWYTVKDAIEASFYVPWQSVVIAVGSVFLIVFITMLYSLHKIRKDNVVDALKVENY